MVKIEHKIVIKSFVEKPMGDKRETKKEKKQLIGKAGNS